jgi:hypothetical protein
MPVDLLPEFEPRRVDLDSPVHSKAILFNFGDHRTISGYQLFYDHFSRSVKFVYFYH